MPGQLSATSQSPLAARHCTVPAAYRSVTQFGPSPGQFSATSQSPSAGLHSTVSAAYPSAGQAAPSPGQVSGTSQIRIARRQTLSDDRYPSHVMLQQSLPAADGSHVSHASTSPSPQVQLVRLLASPGVTQACCKSALFTSVSVPSKIREMDMAAPPTSSSPTPLVSVQGAPVSPS